MKETLAAHPALVEALLNPNAYPEPVRHVRMEETHISYLFFTEKFVYKIKKPIDLGFLDFSSLDRREHFCHEEVALNRRLSDSVYLDVREVHQDGEQIRLDGSGNIIDFAVRMKRLPAECALDQRIREGRIDSEGIERIARRIADFHSSAPTSAEITRRGDLPVVLRNVNENFEQIQPLIGLVLGIEEFEDLMAFSTAFLDSQRGLFEQRAREGRIRDCHGDLHCEHIFLQPAAVDVIDCIEFNQRFRCQDLAADLAFLLMDLEFHGRSDLASVLLETYMRRTGDHGIVDLLPFFKVYRACVRGKVYGLRLKQKGLGTQELVRATREGAAYFRLAHGYTAQVHRRPQLIVMCGQIGTGKSFYSRELSRRWNLVRVSSDELRKKLAGISATEHRDEAWGAGIYSEDFSRRTYDALLEEAGQQLGSGRSVVIDASFRRREDRQKAFALSQQHNCGFRLIEFAASDHEIRERLSRRMRQRSLQASDGRKELVPDQKKHWEAILETEPGYLRVGTDGPRERNLVRLLERLFETTLKETGPSTAALRAAGVLVP